MSDSTAIRPSSTLILVRDASDAPEVLLVRRHSKTVFGGAHVFPGGIVEPVDDEIDAGSLSAVDADKRLGETNARRFYSAAIRELFEETGILLSEEPPDPTLKKALLRGGVHWPVLLDQANIHLAFDHLRYISQWITPPVMARRYATRFFLAAFDNRQTAVPCGGEVTECRWLSAAEALAAGERGDIVLHPPTRLTLEQLARQPSVSALLDWASDVERRGAPTIAAANTNLRSIREALFDEVAVS
ncbi:MAG: NUDIX hydrolase [Pseudomonadota bacterium]